MPSVKRDLRKVEIPIWPVGSKSFQRGHILRRHLHRDGHRIFSGGAFKTSPIAPHRESSIKKLTLSPFQVRQNGFGVTQLLSTHRAILENRFDIPRVQPATPNGMIGQTLDRITATFQHPSHRTRESERRIEVRDSQQKSVECWQWILHARGPRFRQSHQRTPPVWQAREGRTDQQMCGTGLAAGRQVTAKKWEEEPVREIQTPIRDGNQSRGIVRQSPVQVILGGAAFRR